MNIFIYLLFKYINMNKIPIGIIGASGIVGQNLIKFLLNNNFVNLKLCGSDKTISEYYEPIKKCIEKTDGYEITYDYKYVKLNEEFFNDLVVVFFCATNEVTLCWWKFALDKNIHVIDSSSAIRMNPDIPLIIPEINGYLVKDYKIYASPNCSTTLLCMAIYPLLKLSDIKRLDISTYQAVSGAGKGAIEELRRETCEIASRRRIIKTSDNIFKSQIANNCFSHDSSIDELSGYNGEELKIINETKKILGTPDMKISATCVRIPVVQSHCLSVKIKFIKPVLIDDVFKALSEMNGVKIVDDRILNKFPEPIDATNKTDIFVGRIRKDFDDDSDKIYHLFICGDQLLKGASYNAYQIFTEMLK